MGQFPWRHTRAVRLRPERMLVATERCIEYTALSIGCKARRAFLTGMGVMARFTARPGCMARRTLRGTNNLEKKPTSDPPHGPGSGYARPGPYAEEPVKGPCTAPEFSNRVRSVRTHQEVGPTFVLGMPPTETNND